MEVFSPNDLTNHFQSISLEEMDSVSLLNRTDTKFVFNQSVLPDLFIELAKSYKILEIDGKKAASYHTVYFDTKDYRLFTAHHNGKQNRYKLRFRKYVDSNVCFLEIKFKTNKGRTIKNRISALNFEDRLSDTSLDFIHSKSPLNGLDLAPSLENKFTRLTLVSKVAKERLTIDLDLQFKYGDTEKKLHNIVIAEVKREGFARSVFIECVKKIHIKPMSMSKYCIGCVLTNRKLKYNNFKPKLRALNKVSHANIS